jgi:hypothetical protein
MYKCDKEFLVDAITHLLGKGVHIELRPTKSIYHAGGECSGWYDDGKAGVSDEPGRREIIVSCGREDWLGVFAHEYCHFTQDEDGMFETLDENEFWNWLEGKREMTPEEVQSYMISSRELEADNERRTMAMIEKYGLSIEQAGYAKKANSYCLFYNTVARDRKWSDKQKPYDCPEILAKMEGEILDDFTDGPQWDWFHDLVRKHCYD